MHSQFRLKREWPHQWILYLTAGLLFASVLLRSLLTYRDDSLILPVVGLLLAWLLLFGAETVLTYKWPGMLAWHFPVYLVLQTAGILALLFLPRAFDYFATLLCILSIQIAQRSTPRVTAVSIVLLGLLCELALARIHRPADSIALTLIFTSINVLLTFYVLTARRAETARLENQSLAQQLQEANHKLHDHAAELERLAAARERQRLGRELHDSVTQTIFSMTLTTQSALLLWKRDPARVAPQLTRLSELAEHALSELRVLIAELGPERGRELTLSARLRRHLHSLPESISIALEVHGGRSLTEAEEQNLFRIAQEAVNNIVKHAGPCHACIRLNLAEPLWMEIEDDGCGFEPQRVVNHGQVGLIGMRERAAEIGWSLNIFARPGAGTRIRVEKPAGERRV